MFFLDSTYGVIEKEKRSLLTQEEGNAVSLFETMKMSPKCDWKHDLFICVLSQWEQVIVIILFSRKVIFMLRKITISCIYFMFLCINSLCLVITSNVLHMQYLHFVVIFLDYINIQFFAYNWHRHVLSSLKPWDLYGSPHQRSSRIPLARFVPCYTERGAITQLMKQEVGSTFNISSYSREIWQVYCSFAHSLSQQSIFRNLYGAYMCYYIITLPSVTHHDFVIVILANV